jgi:hypothetical protein
MDVENELIYHVKSLRKLQVHLQETVTQVARMISEAEGVLVKLRPTSNQEVQIRPILRSESPFVPPRNLPIPPRNLPRKKSTIPIVVKVEPPHNAQLLADIFYQNPGSSAETEGGRK